MPISKSMLKIDVNDITGKVSFFFYKLVLYYEFLNILTNVMVLQNLSPWCLHFSSYTIFLQYIFTLLITKKYVCTSAGGKYGTEVFIHYSSTHDD